MSVPNETDEYGDAILERLNKMLEAHKVFSKTAQQEQKQGDNASARSRMSEGAEDEKIMAVP